MRVRVEIGAGDGGRPPQDAPLVVEVRDVSRQDVAAVTLGRAEARVAAGDGPLAEVEIDFEPAPGDMTVWAHVDVDGDGRVSVGDWITMESFPVRPGQDAIAVAVRPVGG